MLDEGALVRDGAAVRLTKALSELKIPPTVQGILAARIDRLPAEHKDLLQTLAVIGTEFKLGLVRKVVGTDLTPVPFPHGKGDAASRAGYGADELNRMLSDLQLGEFIYEQPTVGDIEYIFKHALTHDVAYNSVLNERRRMLHGRIGAALESICAESLDDHVAELAHHYARSGNPVKALEYCQRAVEQCVERGSNAEAVARFETGLEILQKLPDDDRRAELELDLRNAVHVALITIKGYSSPEGEQSALRAMALSQRPGINWEKTWSALRAVFFVRESRIDMRRAAEVAAELVALAEEHGSAELIAASANSLARVKMFSGDFERAQQGYDRAWALLESIPKPLSRLTHWSQPSIRIVSAWNLWFLGYPDRSLERVRIATSIAHETGSKAVLEEVNNFATYICEFRREPERMRERAEAT